MLIRFNIKPFTPPFFLAFHKIRENILVTLLFVSSIIFFLKFKIFVIANNSGYNFYVFIVFISLRIEYNRKKPKLDHRENNWMHASGTLYI